MVFNCFRCSCDTGKSSNPVWYAYVVSNHTTHNPNVKVHEDDWHYYANKLEFLKDIRFLAELDDLKVTTLCDKDRHADHHVYSVQLTKFVPPADGDRSPSLEFAKNALLTQVNSDILLLGNSGLALNPRARRVMDG